MVGMMSTFLEDIQEILQEHDDEISLYLRRIDNIQRLLNDPNNRDSVNARMEVWNQLRIQFFNLRITRDSKEEFLRHTRKGG